MTFRDRLASTRQVSPQAIIAGIACCSRSWAKNFAMGRAKDDPPTTSGTSSMRRLTRCCWWAGGRGSRRALLRWQESDRSARLFVGSRRVTMALSVPIGYRSLDAESLADYLSDIEDVSKQLGGKPGAVAGPRSRRRQSQSGLHRRRSAGRRMRQAGVAIFASGRRVLADAFGARVFRTFVLRGSRPSRRRPHPKNSITIHQRSIASSWSF